MKVAIIGAGVGGLTLALSMLEVGIKDIDVYESSSKISELGVGINVLPHAMRELEELGLSEKLMSYGVETSELHYYTKQGQLVWKEMRGKLAGYNWPQISIHRGYLIKVLYDEVLLRLGADRIHTNHQMNDFKRNTNGSVTASFDDYSTTVDVLVACDGIHSTVRKLLYPNEGAPKWGGITMWRGVSLMKPFLKENSMLVAGGSEHRMVIYPIAKNVNADGEILINWIAKHKTTNAKIMPKEDWIHEVNENEIPESFKDFEFLKYSELLKKSKAIYKYPMIDRDPLPNWDFTSVTLLGDAAHPMYPSGSNGASQAIIDARVLSKLLVEKASVSDAIKAYDLDRRLATKSVVMANRQTGPEKCIDIVQKRAPNGFKVLDKVISESELKEVSESYKKMAGFDPNILNNRKSFSI
jgi:5-methylphenazine-1-carboxylate 1-monooxygenase